MRIFAKLVFLPLLIAIYSNAQTTSQGSAPARAALSRLPLLFETNAGQAAPNYLYLARQTGFSMAAGSDRVVFNIPGSEGGQSFLTMRFKGQRGNRLVAEDAAQGQINYLVGPRSQWQTHIATFRQIRYKALYPGIDLAFYGNGKELEHDFILAPGADPRQIELQLDGARSLSLTSSGDLIVKEQSSELRFRKPLAYQLGPEGKRMVDASYRMRGSRISFVLASYDSRLPLVIDPVLTYSTWLAGSGMDDAAGIKVDPTGNVFVTGITSSADFPVKGGFSCPTCNHSADIFITKLDPSGASLVYSTVVGGSGTDESVGIGIDLNGNAIIGGLTGSSDFPLLNSHTTFVGATTAYAFLLSLSADGSQLNYSSLLGQIPDPPGGLAVDSAGAAYLSGQTYDSAFPITAGTIGSTVVPYPFANLFVTKLNSAGDLSYSTVVPGTLPYNNFSFNKNDFQPFALTVDPSGSAYIGGQAGPGLPTTAGTISPTFAGDLTNPSSYVGFLLKINPSASSVSFGTYLPDTAFVRAIAPLATGETYIAGVENSISFPTTSGAFQTTVPAGQNCQCNAGYVAKVDAGATSYSYATFLTGTPATSNFGTSIMSLSLDAMGNVWAAGVTGSSDFPMKNPVYTTFPASQSAGFITELKPDLSNDLFSTFLSGTTGLYHTHQLFATTGANGLVYATGTDDDSDFPTTASSFEPVPPATAPMSTNHVIVAKINTNISGATASFSALSLNFGTWLVNTPSPAQTITVTNSGNGNLQIGTITVTGTDFSQTNTCSSPVAPGASCQLSVVFTPTSTNPQTQTMTIKSNSAVFSQLISLSGQGGQPQFTFGTAQVNFGDLLAGTSGAPVGIALFNTGNGNLIVSNATVTGDYTLSNPCTAPIAPNTLCQVIVTFSPKSSGTRNGTLSITDNAAGSPHSLPLTGKGLTSYPAPTITSVQAVTVDPNGATLRISGGSFFPASTIQWNGSARPATYLDETDIWATLSAADVSSIGEASVTVANPPPGGGTSSPAIATIYLQLLQSTGDAVYEPTSGLIYATVPATATTNANCVIAVNPSTGVVVSTIATGNNPHRLAISSDGSLLYVGLDQPGQVAQYALSSGTRLGAVQLPADPFFGQPVAQDIKVLPGSPHAYVVSLAYTNIIPSAAGILVYDDQTPRANSIAGWSNSGVLGNSLLFLSDAASLYGSDLEVTDYSFYRFNLTATGISLKDSTPNLGGGALTTDGHLVYEATGKIVDPSTLQLVNTFTPPNTLFSALLPVSADSHLYSVGTDFGTISGGMVLASSDLKSLSPLAAIHFPWQPNPQSILRWGSQGLAVRIGSPVTQPQFPTPGDALVLLKSSIVTAVPDFQLGASGSGGLSQAVSAGQTATYNLTLQSTGGFSGSVAFACNGAPQYATCTASPSPIALSANGSATLTIEITTTQTLAARATTLSSPFLAVFGMLFAVVLLPLSEKGRSKRPYAMARTLAILVIAMGLGNTIACGGGSATPPPSVHTVAPGTYTLQLTATSGAAARTTNLTLIVH